MTRSVQRTIACVAFAGAALALAQAPAHIGPGPYKAGHAAFTLVRPGTEVGDRPVFLAVFYPVDPGSVTDSTTRPDYYINPLVNTRYIPSPMFDRYGFEPSYSGLPVASGERFPMLLYIPGGAAPWLHGLLFGPKLATYGYVVVLLSHLDVGLQAPIALKLRDGDARFALDRMLERSATEGDLFAGAIDPGRIAASGWSYGGYEALILASGDDDPCPYLDGPKPAWACAPSVPDPRIKALVLLDGASWVLEWEELMRVRVPVISLHTGYASLTRLGGFGGWNAWHHVAMRATPNFRVDIDYTNHYRFGIACENLVLQAERGYLTPATRDAQLAARECYQAPYLDSVVVYPLITEYMIAFLNTHLAGRPGLQDLLTPGHAQTREDFINFFVTEPVSPNTPIEHVHDFWFFPYQPGSATEKADVAALRPGRPFAVEEE